MSQRTPVDTRGRPVGAVESDTARANAERDQTANGELGTERSAGEQPASAGRTTRAGRPRRGQGSAERTSRPQARARRATSSSPGAVRAGVRATGVNPLSSPRENAGPETPR